MIFEAFRCKLIKDKIIVDGKNKYLSKDYHLEEGDYYVLVRLRYTGYYDLVRHIKLVRG